MIKFSSMNRTNSKVLAWLNFLLVIALLAAVTMKRRTAQVGLSEPGGLLNELLFLMVPIAFASVAALIISRQPDNTIGWLLMIPTAMPPLDLLAKMTIAAVPSAPASPSLGLLLPLWFQMTGWVFLVFPLFLILQLFPTGRPVSPGWRWAGLWTAAMGFAFLTVASFLVKFPNSVDEAIPSWFAANPIGFISEAAAEPFFTFWGFGLAGTALASGAALLIRYRRANQVERQQIKWLLFACTIFVVTYIPQGWGWSGAVVDVISAAWGLSLLAIPAAIAIAILRYRLFDIDLIIRRTLLYTVLTAVLGLVYFGGVTLLQTLFSTAGGGRSPISIVISTLVIAALFAPLRRRLQNLIDRRFFRRKYDAALALDQFARVARNEVALDALSAELLQVVAETVQPSQAGLWLKPEIREESH